MSICQKKIDKIFIDFLRVLCCLGDNKRKFSVKIRSNFFGRLTFSRKNWNIKDFMNLYYYFFRENKSSMRRGVCVSVSLCCYLLFCRFKTTQMKLRFTNTSPCPCFKSSCGDRHVDPYLQQPSWWRHHQDSFSLGIACVWYCLIG